MHCHTRLSDSSVGLEEIIEMAQQRGIDTIAITDHDCQTANVRALNIGRRKGITVIPGVQISATLGDRRADILCYNAKNPDRLEGLCHKNTQNRKKAGVLMANKVAKRLLISNEVLKRCCQGAISIDKRHVMHALIECGLAASFGDELWRTLFTPMSAENVLVRVRYPEPAEVITAIHDAQGVAILARSATGNDMDILEELIPMGLDGVEVWHPENSAEESIELEKFARQRGLLMTGGSNFHGMYTASPHAIGAALTSDEHIMELLQRTQVARTA
ncbi:MAG: PHP domain-containing protein [Oscillospiraceae bacterium]|nr:PHP domain-containing protein [Oscillospiraceae bacterium]